MREALELFGWPEPTSKGKVILLLVRQVVRRFIRRVPLLKPLTNSAQPVNTLLEGALAWERIGELHYYANNTLGTIAGGLRALNLAEQAPPSVPFARAYANMAIVAGLVPLRRIADRYSDRAVENVSKVDQPGVKAFVLTRASVYRMGIGRWE